MEAYTCEICGRKTENPYTVYIEGARLIICERCARRYKNAEPLITKPKRQAKRKPVKKKVVERTVEVVPDYATIIRSAREKRGMTVEDLAKAIAEAESEMHKIERGELVPEIKVAQKLENFLGIKLLREITEEELEKEKEVAQSYKPKDMELTLGDIVVVKKKKGQRNK